MDTPTQPHQPTHISLCAGYGGIDLGLKRVLPDLRTVAYAEIECAAIELLLARMEGGSLDPAPIWSNLRTFPWAEFSGKVDILSGGYPCQPFSSAGKRLGADDPRHLWPAIADGIRLLRPRVCFFENVEGHITLGLSSVLSDLEELGYEVSWGLFSASEVGAPHQRKRVFIMAHRINAGLERHAWNGEGINRQGWFASQQDGPACQSSVCVWPSRLGEPDLADSNGTESGEDWKSSELAYSASDRLNGGLLDGETDKQTQGHAASRSSAWPSRPGEPQHWWEPPRVVGDNRQAEPKVGGDVTRTASGVGYGELCVSCDNRTDELRMLGNGVVPATAARAFAVLAADLAAGCPGRPERSVVE